MGKKMQVKKKRIQTATVRKPPMMNAGATGPKKVKKTKIPGINTITHDDENRNPNSKYAIEMGHMASSNSRKNNS
jgi:hypothetical protein